MLSGEIPPSRRQRRAARARTSPRWSQPRARPRRPRPQLPAHHHLPELHACSRTAAWRRRRARQRPWALVERRRSAARPACRRRATRCSAPGLADVLRPPGRPAVARPEAPARDRDVPGHRAARCCCSTSRWPAWAPRRPSACSRCWPSCKAGHAILLVEHDMDAVFRIADRITVMVNGAVIASDAPDGHPHQPARCRRPTWEGTDMSAARLHRSRPAACTPGTAPATSCTASTCRSRAARPSACSAATAWARPR